MPRGVKAEAPDVARDELRAKIRAELREAAEQAALAPQRRDELILAALAAGVPVPDVAADSGVKRARIYQIKKGAQGDT